MVVCFDYKGIVLDTMERIMQIKSVTMFPNMVYMFYHDNDASKSMGVYIYNTHYMVIVIDLENDTTYSKTYVKDMVAWIDLNDNKVNELYNETKMSGECVVH